MASSILPKLDMTITNGSAGTYTPDGTTMTYTVTITPDASSNAPASNVGLDIALPTDLGLNASSIVVSDPNNDGATVSLSSATGFHVGFAQDIATNAQPITITFTAMIASAAPTNEQLTASGSLAYQSGATQEVVYATANDASGTYFYQYNVTTKATTTFGTPMTGQDSLIFDGAGNIIYTNTGSGLYKYNIASGTTTHLVTVQAGGDLTLSPDGHTVLYTVANYPYLFAYNLATNAAGYLPDQLPGYPSGLAFDSSGNLYANLSIGGHGAGKGGAGNVNEVARIDPATGAVLQTTPSQYLQSASGFPAGAQLDGITFDPYTGHLFLTSGSTNGSLPNVYEVDPKSLAVLGSWTFDGGASLDGLSSDGKGSIFISAYHGGIIQLNLVGGARSFTNTPANVPLIDDTIPVVGTGSTVVINTTASQTQSVGGPGILSGHVFTDLNADGVQQAGDTNLGGVTVALLDSTGKATGATAVTDANGAYSFTGLVPGNYAVAITAPAGDVFSPKGTNADPTKDSIVGTTGTTAEIAVTSGGTTPNQNAGVYAPASLSGTVFADQNADGVQETGDTAVAGVTVQLVGANGQPTGATTTTNANGAYSFTGLVPGSYSVQVVKPAGDSFSPKGTNANPALDSIVNASGATASVTLASGQSVPNQNAGVYAPGALSGHVFTDVNADGVQETGDGNFAGITVALLGGNGQPTGATATTDANGAYSFAGLTPGSYAVAVTAPPGDHFSPVGTGTDPTKDSIVNAGGVTSPVMVASGSTVPNQNAGVYAPASLSGTVFADQNANGVKDAGDTAVAGDTVNLIAGGTVVATTTTDASGNYSFASLTPGSYSVAVTAPSGDSFSPVGTNANPALDSIVNSSGATAPVTLASGQSAPNQNAGVYAPASLSGTVFADQNANGVKDAGDTAVAGDTVNLIAGGTVVATTTTDASGNYSFASLTPGSYSVAVTAPAGDSFSPVGTNANPALDSIVNGSGATAPVTLASGQSMPNQNAGVYAPASLSGLVFTDQNADGVQESGDTNLAGITVSLIGSNGQPTGTTTTTAANGVYSFTGLTPGSYSVAVTAPAGDSFSPVGTNANPALDSIVNGSGATAPVTLASGQSAPNQNAGVYAPASLSGLVFTDQNADGVQESGDTNLAGITVSLIGSNGQPTGTTTTTAANGVYSFTGLTPGSYAVQVTAPSGDSFSPVGTNANPALDSIVNAGGATAPVTLASGQFAPNQNAGVYAPGSLSGHVFSDQNADGVQESGDTPLAGVSVQLLAGGVATGATATTDANGNYSFANLTPGSYSVQVQPLPGETFSPVGTNANPALDSIVNASGATAPVAVNSGTDTPNQNAGFDGPGSISGHVFQDQNANGVQDSGDTNLAGITVQLLDASGTPTGATATTDANGAYSFTKLQPGTYQVKIVAPAGDSFSPKGTNANPALDSVVDGNGSVTAQVMAGANTPNENAGVYQGASISSRVFVDGQCDGMYHVGDPGVPNVTVELLDAAGKPTGHTTITDANGNYTFANIVPGTYEVRFDLPAGLAISEQGTGPDASLNSEADPATGITAATTVLAGTTSHAFNAGVEITGTTTGAGQTVVASGVGQSFNTGGQVVVGAGSNNIHTNAGNNVILLGGGSNVVETSPGNDIVFSCGSTNAQALGTTDYIFGGDGGGVLQGGSGSDYLVAGSGAYTLAGGAGPSTLVSGPSGATVTTSNGLVTGYTVGDEIRPAGGTTSILFQKGDGVDLLDTFKPGHDSLTVYGYAGVASTSVVNGHTVLYLGGNDAIVMNDVYDTAGGTYPGITFVPNIPSVPTLVEYATASGTPTLGLPGSAPVINTISTASAGAVLTATNDPAFTLEGGAGQNTLVGGTGNDTLISHGTGNTITAGNGANTIITGSGGDSISAGSGNNAILLNGNANTASAGDGNNTVVLLGGAAQNTVALGNGANAVFAFGGSGETIAAGTGANTVFAQISQSTIHLGSGNAFVFGDGNTVTVDNPAGHVIVVNGANDITNAGSGDLTLFQAGGTAALGDGNHSLFITGTAVVVQAGNGNNAVVGPAGNASITLGDGQQLVGLGGTGNTVSVGAGNSTIFAGLGNDSVTTGAGNSSIVIAGSGNTVNLGAGNNAIIGGSGGNVFGLAANPAGQADIYNFMANATGGDLLDLSRIAGASAGTVSASASGSDTLISLQTGGSSVVLADLHGVGGLTTAQLTADHAFKFA